VLREARDFTQKELAEVIGSSGSSISAWEGGIRKIKPHNLRRYLTGLGVDERFLGWADRMVSAVQSSTLLPFEIPRSPGAVEVREPTPVFAGPWDGSRERVRQAWGEAGLSVLDALQSTSASAQREAPARPPAREAGGEG
jgi:transcriptional regulator with XRE-family HTH domain